MSSLYVKNPVTGNNVLKTGKVGKKLLASKGASAKPHLAKQNPKPQGQSEEEKEPDFITGPISFTTWTNTKTKQQVLVFGDMHEKNIKCPQKSNKNNTQDINSYLTKLLEQTPKSVDLYLELPMISIRLPKRLDLGTEQGFLFQLARHWRNCLQISKEECQHKDRHRFHYADVRHTDVLFSKVWYYLEDAIVRAQGKTVSQQNQIVKRLGEDVMKICKASDKKGMWKDIPLLDLTSKQVTERALDITKTNIQMKHMKDPNGKVAAALQHIVDSKITPNAFSVSDILQLVSIREVKSLSAKILTFYSGIMEMYIVARMMRVFVHHKASKLPTTQQNVVIYVGDLHASTISDVLKELDFTKKASVKNNKQCLSMSSVSRPLF